MVMEQDQQSRSLAADLATLQIDIRNMLQDSHRQLAQHVHERLELHFYSQQHASSDEVRQPGEVLRVAASHQQSADCKESLDTPAVHSESIVLPDVETDSNHERQNSYTYFEQETLRKSRSVCKDGIEDSRELRLKETTALERAADCAEKYGCTWRCGLASFVYSDVCEAVVSFIIILNIVFMGLEINYLAINLTESTHPVYSAATVIFNCIFLLELLLRVMADNKKFCCSSTWAWNLLDTVIVGLSIMEVLFFFFTQDDGINKNIAALRAARTARMIRILRVVRLPRFLRALRVVIFSIINTMKSLFWSMLVVFGMLFIFAILFTQATTGYYLNEYCMAHPPCPPDARLVDDLELRYYFGKVWFGIFTLFKVLTGGVSWQEVSDALSQVGDVWVALLCIFVAFAYLAVLNVVTGIVCSGAIESANADQEIVVQQHLARQKKYRKELIHIFGVIDKDGSGCITLSEFEEAIADGKQELMTTLQTMEITVDAAWNLFRLLETSGDHLVDVDEFVDGCLKVQGTAKAVDIRMMMLESRWIMKKLGDMQLYLEDDFVKGLKHTIRTEVAWPEPKGTCPRSGCSPLAPPRLIRTCL